MQAPLTNQILTLLRDNGTLTLPQLLTKTGRSRKSLWGSVVEYEKRTWITMQKQLGIWHFDLTPAGLAAITGPRWKPVTTKQAPLELGAVPSVFAMGKRIELPVGIAHAAQTVWRGGPYQGATA